MVPEECCLGTVRVLYSRTRLVVRLASVWPQCAHRCLHDAFVLLIRGPYLSERVMYGIHEGFFDAFRGPLNLEQGFVTYYNATIGIRESRPLCQQSHLPLFLAALGLTHTRKRRIHVHSQDRPGERGRLDTTVSRIPGWRRVLRDLFA